MIYLKIIDDKGKELDLKDLTNTGLYSIKYDCEQLIKEIDEIGLEVEK